MKTLLTSFSLFVLLAVLVPILIGASLAYARGWPESWHAADWSSSGLLPDAAEEPEASIRILAARTGQWKGIFAVHSWLVLKPQGAPRWVRYDVVGWGSPVRRDHRAADGLWYGNRPWIVKEIRGEAAARLIPEIERAIAAYPWSWRGSYVVWPGPNSNSFIAWLTRTVPGLATELPATAVGKDYLGPGLRLAYTPSRTGFQLSLFGVAGLALALEEGIELHLLGATIGADPGSLAVKLPSLGTIGLSGFRA